MKKIFLTYSILLALAGLGINQARAQQTLKIGANPTTVTNSSVLDVEATNKGALLPRVALTSTTDVTTIASPANALTVFNTATAGTAPNNVIPGYYFYSASLNKWVKLVTTEEIKADYKIQSNPISYNHFTSDAGFNGSGQYLGGTANIALGFYSMSNSAFAANGNTALGYNAARSLTSGGYNVAVGAGAGTSLGVGSNNVMVGTQTMEGLGAGDYNTVLGHDAMRYTTLNSNYNTTVGGQTLFSMQGGTNNIALGFLAGGHLSSGNGNVYIGTQAGNPIPLAAVAESNQLYINNGPGSNALIRGDFANKVLTINNTLKVADLNGTATATTGNRPVVADGNGQLMIGTASAATTADNGITKTTDNIQLGGALTKATTIITDVTKTLAIDGLQAGAATDKVVVTDASGVLKSVDRSSFDADLRLVAGTNNHITQDAGKDGLGNTINGDNNIAMGQLALSNAAFAGSDNVAIGRTNLMNLLVGVQNTSVGTGSLNTLQTGSNNSAFGTSGLVNLETGNDNNVVGNESLSALSVGNNNTSLGSRTGSRFTNGNNNIFIGESSGDRITSGNNNIFIGSPLGSYFSESSGSVNNKLFIGNGMNLIEGDFTTATIKIGGKLIVEGINAGATATSGKRPVVADVDGTLMIGTAPVATTANNGLQKISDNIELGGYLTKPTAINTDATNTLSIGGLEPGAITDKIVVTDVDGVLKSVDASTLTSNSWSTLGNTGTNPANNFLGTTDATDLIMRTNNTEQMRITSAGNIGIGTANTSHKLEVRSEVPVGGTVPNAIAVFTSKTNTIGTTNESNAEIQVLGFNGGNNRGVTLGIGKPSIYGDHDYGYLTLGSGDAIWAQANGLHKFSTKAGVTLNGSGYPGVEFYNDQSDNGDAYTFYSSVPTLNGTLMRIKAAATAGNGNLLAIEGGQTGATLVVDKNGKLGIGTYTPATTLDIVGTAQISALNSSATPVTGRPVVADANGQLMIGSATSSGWGLTGNAGTNPTTNFIGTTDTQNLVLKAANNSLLTLGSNSKIGVGLTPDNYSAHQLQSNYNIRFGIPADGNNQHFSIAQAPSSFSGSSSQKPFSLIVGNSYLDRSDVFIGGGLWDGTEAAVQNIRFYTANVKDTPIGTERMVLDRNGNLGIGTSTPNSTLQVNGSVSANITGVTTNYTLTDLDYTVVCRGTNTITLTLPDPTLCKGRIYVIINNSTNSVATSRSFEVSSDPSGNLRYLSAVPIAGSAIGSITPHLGNKYTLQSDGNVWVMISN